MNYLVYAGLVALAGGAWYLYNRLKKAEQETARLAAAHHYLVEALQEAIKTGEHNRQAIARQHTSINMLEHEVKELSKTAVKRGANGRFQKKTPESE